MATVDITEYQNVANDGVGNRVAAGVEPARVVQQVPISGVSAQSAAVNDATKFLRIHTDSTIRIAFGMSPVASATSQRMVANSTEYFGITPGVKVAVIAAT